MAQKNTFNSNYQIFGHRGCRGLMPENSLEGFKKAIDIGVDGIEWDVVVSSDGKLVISHEPYIHNSYCYNVSGKEISANEGKKINLHQLTTFEIAQYDCGSKINKKFPNQEQFKTHKPTVEEAFQKLDLSTITILFEIKSTPKDYGIYQPFPKEYAQIIANEIKDFEHKDNIIFMCFDTQLLEALYQILPKFRFVYLTYKPFASVTNFLNDLTFKPYALGMYYRTIRKRDVKIAHEKKVTVFSWTVNDSKAFNKMVNYGVNGIITDYPNKFIKNQ